MFTNSYLVDNEIKPQITALHVNDEVHLAVTLSQFCPTLLSIFVLNDFISGLYKKLNCAALKSQRINWWQYCYPNVSQNVPLKIGIVTCKRMRKNIARKIHGKFFILSCVRVIKNVKNQNQASTKVLVYYYKALICPAAFHWRVY